MKTLKDKEISLSIAEKLYEKNKYGLFCYDDVKEAVLELKYYLNNYSQQKFISFENSMDLLLDNLEIKIDEIFGDLEGE